MPNLRNVYRRYSMACATATIAIFIGFVMQRSEASHAPVTPNASGNQSTSLIEPLQLEDGLLSAPLERAAPKALPPIPKDRSAKIVLPGAPMVMAAAEDLRPDILTDGRVQASPECDTVLQVTPAAGAMVHLVLNAPCQAGERVQVQHGNLVFSDILDSQGSLDVMVPALTSVADFSVVFANGASADASAHVDSLVFYERTVIRWTGDSGVELHAREFGASYGDEGHVWRERTRDLSALVGGMGGYLTPLGNPGLPDAARAEVYTFPSVTSTQSGRISLSVEAEITPANCGREITVIANKIEAGEVTSTREMRLEIPACDAVGQFLVLKNLVEDLTIAQK